MNSLVCNRLLLGSTTLWSVDFNLEFGFEVICSLNPVLYFCLLILQFMPFYVCQQHEFVGFDG